MTQIIFTTRRSVRGRSNKEAPRWQTDANKSLNDDNNPTSCHTGAGLFGHNWILSCILCIARHFCRLYIKWTRPNDLDRSANWSMILVSGVEEKRRSKRRKIFGQRKNKTEKEKEENFWKRKMFDQWRRGPRWPKKYVIAWFGPNTYIFGTL